MLSENPLVSLFPQFFLSAARSVDWRSIQVPRMSVYAKYATMTVSITPSNLFMDETNASMDTLFRSGTKLCPSSAG